MITSPCFSVSDSFSYSTETRSSGIERIHCKLFLLVKDTIISSSKDNHIFTLQYKIMITAKIQRNHKPYNDISCCWTMQS